MVRKGEKSGAGASTTSVGNESACIRLYGGPGLPEVFALHVTELPKQLGSSRLVRCTLGASPQQIGKLRPALGFEQQRRESECDVVCLAEVVLHFAPQLDRFFLPVEHLIHQSGKTNPIGTLALA
jgi:hypothetical protein